MVLSVHNFAHRLPVEPIPSSSTAALPVVQLSKESPARSKLPMGAWDSHVHVFDESRWKLSPSHPYRPMKADEHDLLRFERSLGITNVCLIAFSVYGTDNTSILDSLQYLEGRARAVVCIDPVTITDKDLLEMHDLGVRGVRVNLKTTSSKMESESLRKTLHAYAGRIRHLGWRIQMYVGLDQIELVAPIIPELGVVCIFDHIGSPDRNAPPRTQRGYKQFMDLLKSGQVYAKISGTYRFPGMPETDEYIREVLRIAPDRVVFASDWPHSGSVEANPGGDRTKVQPYRRIDDQAWVDKCLELCDYDEGLIRKLWVDNPNRLWDFK